MKKILPFIVFFLVIVAFAFYMTYSNAKTDFDFTQTWELQENAKQKVEIYGTEQNVELSIVETSNPQTKVTVSGKISKTSVNTIKDTKSNEEGLYIPISKHGFRLYTSQFGKDTLKITVELAKNADPYEVFLDTVSGEVKVNVPQTFDGKYDIMLNNGAKLTEKPETKETSASVIKVDAYTDVKIVKGK